MDVLLNPNEKINGANQDNQEGDSSLSKAKHNSNVN